MVHEHLAVAVAARADTDRRDGDRVGDQAGDRVGYALEHHREAARFGESDRVVDDVTRGVERLALHAQPAERVDRLRREPDVAHHRDLGVEDRLDRVDALVATFELHRAGARAHERGRVADRLLARDVVAHPRQVADDECLRLRARDRGDVVRHVVDGDVERVVVTEHDHRQRVADEDHVDPGFVDDARGGRVVGRDHDERCARALAGDDVGRARRTRRGHLATSTVQGTHGSRRHAQDTPQRSSGNSGEGSGVS